MSHRKLINPFSNSHSQIQEMKIEIPDIILEDKRQQPDTYQPVKSELIKQNQILIDKLRYINDERINSMKLFERLLRTHELEVDLAEAKFEEAKFILEQNYKSSEWVDLMEYERKPVVETIYKPTLRCTEMVSVGVQTRKSKQSKIDEHLQLGVGYIQTQLLAHMQKNTQLMTENEKLLDQIKQHDEDRKNLVKSFKKKCHSVAVQTEAQRLEDNLDIIENLKIVRANKDILHRDNQNLISSLNYLTDQQRQNVKKKFSIAIQTEKTRKERLESCAHTDYAYILMFHDAYQANKSQLLLEHKNILDFITKLKLAQYNFEKNFREIQMPSGIPSIINTKRKFVELDTNFNNVVKSILKYNEIIVDIVLQDISKFIDQYNILDEEEEIVKINFEQITKTHELTLAEAVERLQRTKLELKKEQDNSAQLIALFKEKKKQLENKLEENVDFYEDKYQRRDYSNAGSQNLLKNAETEFANMVQKTRAKIEEIEKLHSKLESTQNDISAVVESLNIEKETSSMRSKRLRNLLSLSNALHTQLKSLCLSNGIAYVPSLKTTEKLAFTICSSQEVSEIESSPAKSEL